jgi:hypothetical protein
MADHDGRAIARELADGIVADYGGKHHTTPDTYYDAVQRIICKYDDPSASLGQT